MKAYLAMPSRAEPMILFARRGDRAYPIRAEEIVRAQAQGKYVAVFLEQESYVLRMSLSELADRLGEERFIRVHKSHLISLSAVVELRDTENRRLEIRFEDGSTIVASRRGSMRLRRLMR